MKRYSGRELKKIRKEKAISVVELAARIGVSRQTVHNWESDICAPTDKYIAQLENVLGVNFFASCDSRESINLDMERVTKLMASCRTFVELRDTILAFLKTLGIDSFLYMQMNRSDIRDEPVALVMSTVDRPWAMHYLEQKYVEIDPTWPYAIRNTLPSSTKELYVRAKRNRAYKAVKLFTEYARHGYAFTRIIPIHSNEYYSTFNMTVHADINEVDNPEEAILQEEIMKPMYPLLSYLGFFVHENASRILREIDKHSHGLSEKELQTITLLAKGCDIAEIASHQFVTRAAVNARISKIKQKLHVNTREQLVLEAASRSLLDHRVRTMRLTPRPGADFKPTWLV